MEIRVLSSAQKYIPPHFIYREISVKERDDPGFSEYLHGLMNALYTSSTAKVDEYLRGLIQYIYSVKHLYTLDVAEHVLAGSEFREWMKIVNGLAVFPDGTYRTGDSEIIIRNGAQTAGEPSPPYFTDALTRKDKTINILKHKNIKFLNGLPPVISENEVVFRPAEEISARIQALAIVTMYAKSFFYKKKLKVEKMISNYPALRGYFTLNELRFFTEQNKTIALEKAVRYIWRFDSLELLLWSVNLKEELYDPFFGMCDLTEVGKIAMKFLRNSDKSRITLREPSVILDNLDLYYRLHWATRNAQYTGSVDSLGVLNSAVYERHYALNWLIQYKLADWDSVSTPT